MYFITSIISFNKFSLMKIYTMNKDLNTVVNDKGKPKRHLRDATDTKLHLLVQFGIHDPIVYTMKKADYLARYDRILIISSLVAMIAEIKKHKAVSNINELINETRKSKLVLIKLHHPQRIS